MHKVFKDLEGLSERGIYKKNHIEYWLLNEELRYKALSKDFDILEKEYPDTYIRGLTSLRNESMFLGIYEVLLEVIECYNNELYCKKEVAIYEAIKQDKHDLEAWLQRHKLDERKKLLRFNRLFQNIFTVSGYEFLIREPLCIPVTIKLDELDFKHSVHFFNILNQEINGNRRTNKGVK
ncbi:hypothetical protein [Algibacter lectus]|uniref:hypothetical protein n=1 Tax=Algibacter lectus TaxID=221126 RepID=UPI0024958C77|nr:hypothetical protein [Algibacter lectus]